MRPKQGDRKQDDFAPESGEPSRAGLILHGNSSAAMVYEMVCDVFCCFFFKYM